MSIVLRNGPAGRTRSLDQAADGSGRNKVSISDEYRTTKHSNQMLKGVFKNNQYEIVGPSNDKMSIFDEMQEAKLKFNLKDGGNYNVKNHIES